MDPALFFFFLVQPVQNLLEYFAGRKESFHQTENLWFW